MNSARWQDEMTSSALKLVIDVSMNKLEIFRNSLQPNGFVSSNNNTNNSINMNSNINNNNNNPADMQSKSFPDDGVGNGTKSVCRRTANSMSPSNRLYRIMVILKIAKKARSMLIDQHYHQQQQLQQAQITTAMPQTITTTTTTTDNNNNMQKQQLSEAAINTSRSLENNNNVGLIYTVVDQLTDQNELPHSHTVDRTQFHCKRDRTAAFSDDTTPYPATNAKRLCDAKQQQISSVDLYDSPIHQTNKQPTTTTTTTVAAADEQQIVNNFSELNNNTLLLLSSSSTTSETDKSGDMICDTICAIDSNHSIDSDETSQLSSPSTSVNNIVDDYQQQQHQHHQQQQQQQHSRNHHNPLHLHHLHHHHHRHEHNVGLYLPQTNTTVLSHSPRPLITGIN